MTSDQGFSDTRSEEKAKGKTTMPNIATLPRHQLSERGPSGMCQLPQIVSSLFAAAEMGECKAFRHKLPNAACGIVYARRTITYLAGSTLSMLANPGILVRGSLAKGKNIRSSWTDLKIAILRSTLSYIWEVPLHTPNSLPSRREDCRSLFHAGTLLSCCATFMPFLINRARSTTSRGHRRHLPGSGRAPARWPPENPQRVGGLVYILGSYNSIFQNE
ncbi:hypothetical protein F5Y19DRAFT_321961 [Xylariaceae sp. FL1651]|nr:hypothetical protein F5Y19DRAFT_321961 [Xylariaceae sp. FL1651]